MEAHLDNAPCGYVVFNDEGRIREVNATMLSQLGYQRDELVGTHIESILPIASRIFYQTHFFPLLALHDRADEIFISLLAKNKESLPMLAYARRKNGEVACVLVSVQQRQKYEAEILAAQRTAEEALRSNKELLAAKNLLQDQAHELNRRILKFEQLNRELLQVTHILFHDLREPLRKIETFSNLILTEAELTEDSKLALTKIDAACGRMSQLLRALQQFVSVDSANEPVAHVELSEIIREAYATAQAAFDDETPLAMNDVPAIQGYPSQLRLLFTHLFENALKFRSPDRPLRIHVEASVVQHNRLEAIPSRYQYQEFVQIFVSDNGIGIEEKYRHTIFDLLTKLNLDSTNACLGCGLAICRKVTENHYGWIQIAPSTGDGTTFKLLLPLAQN